MHQMESCVVVEDGLNVWTRIVGGGAQHQRPALLVLHGGPGIGHDYLENLSELANEHQRVVFYDQLGCGRSDQPKEAERWVIGRFVREVDAVRRALGLDSVVVLGQSWGGMLAIEYLLTKPAGVHGAILSSALSSAPLMTSELTRLKQALPEQTLSTLLFHEKNGSTDSAEYKEATAQFYRRHVLRVDPLPAVVLDAIGDIHPVYEVMWGKNEFSVTGNLKHWDRTAELDQIDCPTLIISGEFDESTPKINQVLNDGIRGSVWKQMAGCSHLCHLEDPGRYLSIVRTFLDEIEAARNVRLAAH